MKKLLVLSLIVLSACGSDRQSNLQKVYYSQLSSTCDAPSTTLTATSEMPFNVDYETHLDISQSYKPYIMCEFKAMASARVQGGNLITQGLSVHTENCEGVPFEWEETYAININGDDITLIGASCTNVYRKR